MTVTERVKLTWTNLTSTSETDPKSGLRGWAKWHTEQSCRDADRSLIHFEVMPRTKSVGPRPP